MDQKTAFALRLRQAMQEAGLEPRPGVLHTLFNTRYWGPSVSFQSVSRWLQGKAIPEQDKLLTLAQLLNVEPETLRFGDAVHRSIQERQQRWEQGSGYLERELFDLFLQLEPPQRKLAREIILALMDAQHFRQGVHPTDKSKTP